MIKTTAEAIKGNGRIRANAHRGAMRAEWRKLAKRIDTLHHEAYAANTQKRVFEIREEIDRCRARIREIVAAGVTWDSPKEQN